MQLQQKISDFRPCFAEKKGDKKAILSDKLTLKMHGINPKFPQNDSHLSLRGFVDLSSG